MNVLCCNQKYLGRYGNFVGGLINLISFASQNEYDKITFVKREHYIHGYKTIILNDINITSKTCTQTTVTNKFSDSPSDGVLHIYNILRYSHTLPYYELQDIGRKYVCNIMDININKDDISSDALVIHMRSEDIFGGRVGSMVDLYVQPPYVFYEHIISNTNYPLIVIVSSPDFNNPCIVRIEALCKKLNKALRFVSVSVKDDFEYLCNCRNLVLSTSTFAFYAAMLNKNIKNLYVFNTPNFFHNVPPLHHLNLHMYKGVGYLVRFTNSKQDVDTILNFHASNLIELSNTSDTIGI